MPIKPTLMPRDVACLARNSRYGRQERRDYTAALFPGDSEGGVTRARARVLESLGLLWRHVPRITRVGRDRGVACPPVFDLTVRGSEVLNDFVRDRLGELPVSPYLRACLKLAAEEGRIVRRAEPSFSRYLNVWHDLDLGRDVAMIDDALAAQADDRARVRITGGPYYEHEVIQPAALGGAKYRLWRKVSTDPLVFWCPDVLFETMIGGDPSSRRVWAIEHEEGSEIARRCWKKKRAGVAAAGEQELWKSFFPLARDWRCLFITPGTSFMESLLQEMKEDPARQYCAAIDGSKARPGNLLSEDLVWTASGGPFPLFPRVSAPVPAAEAPAAGRPGAGPGAKSA